MIRVRHVGCAWAGSILEWDRLPIAGRVWPTDTIMVDTKACPLCGSTITCGSLLYDGEMALDAALSEIAARQ